MVDLGLVAHGRPDIVCEFVGVDQRDVGLGGYDDLHGAHGDSSDDAQAG
jgi:hypothetical protein